MKKFRNICKILRASCGIRLFYLYKRSAGCFCPFISFFTSRKILEVTENRLLVILLLFRRIFIRLNTFSLIGLDATFRYESLFFENTWISIDWGKNLWIKILFCRFRCCTPCVAKNWEKRKKRNKPSQIIYRFVSSIFLPIFSFIQFL